MVLLLIEETIHYSVFQCWNLFELYYHSILITLKVIELFPLLTSPISPGIQQ